jgi:hypothetical protein
MELVNDQSHKVTENLFLVHLKELIAEAEIDVKRKLWNQGN